MTDRSRYANRHAARRFAKAGRFGVGDARVADALAWWPAWLRMWEIGVAAPQVIAHRTGRMIAGGAFPGQRDRDELLRMTQEKAEAWFESASDVSLALWKTWSAIAASSMQPLWLASATLPWTPGQWNSQWNPQWSAQWEALYANATRQWARSAPRIAAAGLAPVHRRATANARRLRARV